MYQMHLANAISYGQTTTGKNVASESDDIRYCPTFRAFLLDRCQKTQSHDATENQMTIFPSCPNVPIFFTVPFLNFIGTDVLSNRGKP